METVLKFFLGFLAEYIIAFFKNFQAARLDDQRLWTTAEEIINQIAVAHPDWPGEQKRAYAFDAIKVAGKSLLGDVADSAINTVIELVVQRMKAKAA